MRVRGGGPDGGGGGAFDAGCGHASVVGGVGGGGALDGGGGKEARCVRGAGAHDVEDDEIDAAARACGENGLAATPAASPPCSMCRLDDGVCERGDLERGGLRDGVGFGSIMGRAIVAFTIHHGNGS